MTDKCPICGNDQCTMIYVQSGEAIGCDMCIDVSVPCPHCGMEIAEAWYYKRGKPIGCEYCVNEVAKWEYDNG